MFKNYLKIAFRSLWRNKVFSIINIVGLAIAMACSSFIFLWIDNELSYDGFHKDKDAIFLTMHHVNYANGHISTMWQSTLALREAMKREIPEIKELANVSWPSEQSVCFGKLAFRESGIYASESFFDLFSFKLIQGNQNKLLNEVDNIVITEKLAIKFFGIDWKKKNLIGKIINLNRKDDYKIAGVIANIPAQTSIWFNFVITEQKHLQQMPWLKEWGNQNHMLFVKLHHESQIKNANKKIAKIISRNRPQSKDNFVSFLYPLNDLRLKASFNEGKETLGRLLYVYIFSFAALFLLSIATINFINLTTALSITRIKEIGIRKVNGASKRSLALYFLGESFLIVVSALLLASLMVLVAHPYYNQVMEIYTFLPNGNAFFWLIVIIIVIIIGLLGGVLPFQTLISAKAANITSSTLSAGSVGSILLRKGLVVLQYVLSIILIIGTIFIYKQLNYIHTKNIGLDRQRVMYAWLQGSAKTQFQSIKTILLKDQSIEVVSHSNQSPLSVGNSTTDPVWPGKMAHQEVSFNIISADYNFLTLMKVELKKGRNFSEEFASDSSNFIINEATAKVIGVKDPIGLDLEFWGKKGKIIGIVKDFHEQSLHQPISPLIIRYMRNFNSYDDVMLYLRYKPGRVQEAVGALKEVHQTFTPEFPLYYRFLDDDFNQTYKTEKTFGVIINFFSFIAIFISCLGLFALALLTIQKRTKEIGIRKVLGASIMQINLLVSMDFIKLVLLANVIAIPIAYYIVDKWLQNYAYHIDLFQNWWVFLVATVLVMVLAILTISFQTIKTAMMNPVNSLRSE